MTVLITFVAINYEEMVTKDFASKYFLKVNVVVIRTPLVRFLSLSSFTYGSAETE